MTDHVAIGPSGELTIAEPRDPLIGTLIDGRFRVDARLAAGGFGAIYIAVDTRSGRQVAVKVLHRSLVTDPAAVRRFHREGALLLKLRDPHTVTAYELGELADGGMFIVMELLRGQTAYDRLRDRGPLPWERVIELARGACSSLAEAHARGIVHRDLKPANLFLEQRGDADFVKLLDFGIAKILRGSEISQTQLTVAGRTVGTMEYMSPEQLQGELCTARSDLYALGVVMYELLVGVRPFAEVDGARLLAAMLAGPPRLRAFSPVPPELERVVMRLLAPEPHDRYKDATAVEAALARIVDDDEANTKTAHAASGDEAPTWFDPRVRPRADVRVIQPPPPSPTPRGFDLSSAALREAWIRRLLWGLVIAAVAVIAIVLAACGDAGECASARHGDGSYTLALDGVCLDGVTVDHLAGGTWQTSGTDLAWQAAPGGLEVTLAADAPAQAIELAIPALDADQMFQQGYQSWSFAGTVQIPLMVALDDDGRARMKAARTGSAIDEVRGVAFHAALFRKGDSGRVLVIAALSAVHAVTGIAAVRDVGAPARLSIIYGPAREPLAPDPGDGRAHGEVLYLATADTPEDALDLVSAELASAHAGGFAPKRPPGGWFSWNSVFGAVDAATVRAQLDAAQTTLLPAGMPLVEIDDGWELAWGDWRDNAKFPDGLPAMAAEIRARGLVAGVWLAPFLVDVTSQPAAADPSLFVRGPDGAPLVHQSPGVVGSYYVLDGSNPASMAIVTDQIRRLAAGGFTFFKLDFLYAGALAGQRSQDVTGTEALRAGLALVREAAGPDAILNACGAPTLPVLGLADSLRVGADTAYAGVDIGFIMAASAARNLAARAHLWPLVWPDADQAQLRAPLSADEARTSAVIAALASAPYSLGDDLAQLDPARRAIALDPVILDLAGAARPAAPDGLMVDPSGAIALSPLLENGLLTPPPATFHATGKSGTVYTITIDWTDTHAVSITP